MRESLPVKRKNCIIILSLDVIAEHWEMLKEYDKQGQDIVWGQGLEVPGSALVVDADRLLNDPEFPLIDIDSGEQKTPSYFGFPVSLDVFRPTVSVTSL